MNYLKIALGIFAALAASRFIPHPPNFTSLLALSFYIPALLGAKYILAVIFAFVLTDSFIGLHSTIIFTWGSVAFIGLISKFFSKSISTRIFGSLLGACSFYLITKRKFESHSSHKFLFFCILLLHIEHCSQLHTV